MKTSLSEKVTFDKAVSFSDWVPICVTFSKFNDFKAWQLRKAKLPIVSTVLGIMAELRCRQKLNAFAPIVVVPYPISRLFNS